MAISRITTKPEVVAKAQLKQVAIAIEAMTADGYWLKDIVKAILKEAE